MPDTDPPAEPPPEAEHVQGDVVEPGRAVELRADPADLARAGAYLAGATPEEIIATAHKIAVPLKGLIDGARLSADVGGGKRHVEVGGWQALGAMLGALGGQPLHAETVWAKRMLGDGGKLDRTQYHVKVTRYYKRDQGGGIREVVEYDVDGYSWEACCEVRTAAGVLVGKAEGMCARDEETWNSRPDFAVRSMAETRAESRAYRRAVGWLIHLAGYNPTPAEEMGGGAGAIAHLPGWAGYAEKDRKALALKSLSYLIDGNERSPTALAMLQIISREFEGVPEAIVDAFAWTAHYVQQRADGKWEPPPDPAKERAKAAPPAAEPTAEEAAAIAAEQAAEEAARAAPPEGMRFDPDTNQLVPVEDAPAPAPEAEIVDAEIVHEPAPTGPPTPPEAAHGETPKDHLARLRRFGCKCKVPFGINGMKADTNDQCPIHGIPF